jgi:site-specific recombinase XerD
MKHYSAVRRQDRASEPAPTVVESLMPTTLKTAISTYVRAANLAQGTRAEYQTTLSKWKQWGNGVHLEKLCRKEIREFLVWVDEQAFSDNGTNPGRTTNKARAHLRAIVAWAWDQDLIDSLPRFPKPIEQRDVAGRHYLTKEELNALYFATYQMKRLRGWSEPHSIGRLAMRSGTVLQLWHRHGNGMAVGTSP